MNAKTKRNLQITRFTTALLVAGNLFAFSAQADFFDDFEGASLDSFWSLTEDSGYVVHPGTTRAHSGSQSAELVTVNTGLGKGVGIYHDFATPTYGVASVWVYDTVAYANSANYIKLLAGNAAIESQDYNLNYTNGGTYYCWAGEVGGPTSVVRTENWHLFSLAVLSNSTTICIDGNTVYSGPATGPISRISLRLSGPSWRPPCSVQFDDFRFVSQPTPGETSLQMYAGLSISGTVGAPYEIQYKDDLSADWLPLTVIALPASPFFFVDANSPGSAKRFYRALAKP